METKDLPVSVETMFLWSDIQFFKIQTLQSDIDSLVEEFWHNYLNDMSSSRVHINDDVLQPLKGEYLKGPPFSNKMFDQAAVAIETASLSQPFLKCIKNFCCAALYSKRCRKCLPPFPHKLFQQIAIESQSSEWQSIVDNGKASIWRKKLKQYPGIYAKESVILPCSVDDAIDLLSNKEFRLKSTSTVRDIEIIEDLGDGLKVERVINDSVLPGVKHSDTVLFSCFTKLEDNSWILLGCSVDHPATPKTKQYHRTILDIGCHILKPIDENNCRFDQFYQVIIGSKLLKTLVQFDFILKHDISNLMKMVKTVHKFKGKGK